uniref:exodeoxyribonuclease III n=1 Tax=Seriola lalandi dorsalis TaxID=1841481 RepID=A0A3B4X6W9_SERLL
MERIDSSGSLPCGQMERDKNGRWIKIRFTVDKKQWTIMNVYAPNDEVERTQFIRTITHRGKDCDIIMGDFNLKQSTMDVNENCKWRQDMSRTVLQNLLSVNNLCDLWRHQHPKGRDYTRVQSHLGLIKRSRIDLVLVKKMMVGMFNTVRFNLNFLSDHAFIWVGVESKGEERGGVYGILMQTY